MKYWLRTFVGLAICGAAVVAFDSGLYHLVRTGTCASGGPYVSARPCPEGTGLHVLSLVGGIFGGMIGAGIYAARGKSGRPSPVGLGAVLWALLFCTIAGVTMLAAFGPASPDETGLSVMAIVFAVLFVPMGIAPVLASYFTLRGVRKKVSLAGHSAPSTPSPASPPAPAPAAPPATGPEPPAPVAPDAPSLVDQLERLARLHKDGVLTEAEFEQQKKKLLGG